MDVPQGGLSKDDLLNRPYLIKKPIKGGGAIPGFWDDIVYGWPLKSYDKPIFKNLIRERIGCKSEIWQETFWTFFWKFSDLTWAVGRPVSQQTGDHHAVLFKLDTKTRRWTTHREFRNNKIRLPTYICMNDYANPPIPSAVASWPGHSNSNSLSKVFSFTKITFLFTPHVLTRKFQSVASSLAIGNRCVFSCLTFYNDDR